jgi:spore maturation protein CgeB
MKQHINALLSHPEMAREMAARGLETVLSRHTCAHRVDELFEIAEHLGLIIGEPEIAESAARQGVSP